jgi:hypothetical protein
MSKDSSDGWAAIAAALQDRADAAADEAARAAARAKVWRRAAELAREGGVVGAKIARVAASGAIGAIEDPVWLALALRLCATREETEAWLGPLPCNRADEAAALLRSVAAERDPNMALPPPDQRRRAILNFDPDDEGEAGGTSPFPIPIVDPPDPPNRRGS